MNRSSLRNRVLRTGAVAVDPDEETRERLMKKREELLQRQALLKQLLKG